MKVCLLVDKLARVLGIAPFRTALFADFGYGRASYYYGVSIVKYSQSAKETLYRLEINGCDGNWPDDFYVLASFTETPELWESSKNSLLYLIDLLKEKR